MTSLNAQVKELARMDNQYETGVVAQENKQAVKLVQSSLGARSLPRRNPRVLRGRLS